MPTEATSTAPADSTSTVTTATPTPAPSVPASTPAPVPGSSATTPAPVPGATTQASPEAPAAAQTAPKVEKDEVAESLALLNRELRSAKAKHDKYAAKETTLADKVVQADQFAKAREALTAKDFATALRALDPNLSVDEAILTLIQQAKDADAVPMSQAEIERITAQKIEEDRQLQAKARADESAASLARANESYANACLAEFTPGSFPLIAALGVSDEQIQKHVEGVYKKGNPVPSPVETMRHFEADYEQRLKAQGYSRAQIAEAKADAVAAAAAPPAVAKSPATAPVVDTMGGRVTEPAAEKPESLADFDKRMKAQMRARRGQAGASQ